MFTDLTAWQTIGTTGILIGALGLSLLLAYEFGYSAAMQHRDEHELARFNAEAGEWLDDGGDGGTKVLAGERTL